MSKPRLLPHRIRPLQRWLLGVAVGMAVALGAVIAADRAFFSTTTRVCTYEPAASSRPALQRILDGVVTGPSRLAPGVTAYVAGPHGSWTGAAGFADTSTCAPMPVDARMRLESVSTIYTATLILQLAQEGKLSRHRHGRPVAAGPPPLRQPDHDPRAADHEQRPD